MKKILVANRGEIALRIMRTIRKMGLQSVAVFSEVDRLAPHVLFADEAVAIGPSPSSQSYLNASAIINAALRTGADGIHPGYGFLSENATFAQQVQDAGIIFIGPSPGAMRTMGSKLAAKEAVKAFGIPMVPGTDGAVESVAEAKKVAASIGYPVLIKASAGGGGKGMRVVHQENELEEQMARAISEAQSSFGDGAVFIEKYVASPRHIEVQVVADQYGNIVHGFERECSIQRRHQKVVEETPSPVINEKLREQLGEAAVMVARSCNYTSTGTVEFLVDEKLNYYFLEMNTRLQVEHAVSEMITGLDLVEQQIRIASGLPLGFTQDDLRLNGHAIELRVYAEDPLNNFLPSVGKLTRYVRPAGEGIRVDDGYVEGMEIPVYYDPMIAKLVVHGKTRTEAIQRMLQAIRDYRIEGVATTLPFGRFVFEHEAFFSGKFDTHFVSNYYTPSLIHAREEEEAALAALAGLRIWLDMEKITREPQPGSPAWKHRLL